MWLNLNEKALRNSTFFLLLLRHVTGRQEEGSVNGPLSALKTEPIKGAKPFTPVRYQRS